TVRTGRRSGARREDEISPVVAVDRLFRDGLTGLARSAQAPAVAPGAEAHERPGEAADGLLGDDTVRLGRVTRPQLDRAERPAPDRSAAPGANPTGPDQIGPDRINANPVGANPIELVVPATSDLRSE
ncbi:hypothetical protein, partial [Kitasatospora purpeofusca]|uniref:hypothetical protein n=1 Tax=Kitasatospora purpeofusca TaxID=67352 RepID=UPI00366654F5